MKTKKLWAIIEKYRAFSFESDYVDNLFETARKFPLKYTPRSLISEEVFKNLHANTQKTLKFILDLGHNVLAIDQNKRILVREKGGKYFHCGLDEIKMEAYKCIEGRGGEW
jgi:uncharacterized LabA/DUF88 family protein